MNPIRVLLVDDHVLFREGMRAMLDLSTDLEVVGQAGTGEDAIATVRELKPDVILMDIQMPGINGIESTRSIAGNFPEIGIIIVTMFEDDDSVFAAMRAGARGYVLKDADFDEIHTVIRAVAAGDAHFGPHIASRLTQFFSRSENSRETQSFPDLTTREREVLDLIASGMSNQQIADHLYLSPKTVRNHISNIFAKLQVVDRAQAIVRARQAGLG